MYIEQHCKNTMDHLDGLTNNMDMDMNMNITDQQYNQNTTSYHSSTNN